MIKQRPAPTDLSWEEVAGAIFHAKGIDKGLWKIAFRLRFGAMTSVWKDEASDLRLEMPTGMVGIESLAIAPADAPGTMVFDAANRDALLQGRASDKRSSEPKTRRPRGKSAKS